MNVDARLADAKDRDCRVQHLSSRDRFHIPPGRKDPSQTYLLGNSLGLQPKTTEGIVLEELRKWRTLGAAAHFHGAAPWMPYHEFLTEPLADIVGAQPDEVVAMNSLTVNLHLLLATFYAPSGTRHGILMESNPFPSDYHAITTYLCHCGRSVSASLFTIAPDPATLLFGTEQICAAIERQRDQLALIVLPGVHYYTGEVLDIGRITEVAHSLEIPIGWDLAHAVGNIPLELHRWEVDFAVWCSYKYLNSGPGAVGGAFIHDRHAANTRLPRLAGWWGHDKATRFQMQPVFDPIPTAEGWQLSNPPILALAPLRSSLDEFAWAGGMEGLRSRSEALLGYLEERLRDELGDAVQQLTPREPAQRGCQLSLRLRLEAWKGSGISSAHALVGRLEERDIIVDAREPDVVRVCMAPLYNSFEDAHRFVEALREIAAGPESPASNYP